MTDLLVPLRWLHVLAAASWLGEVVVINVVLVPALADKQGADRRRYFEAVFPRLFRLASVLSIATVATGALLMYATFQGNWALLTTTRRGNALLLGGTLGLLLTLFHFVAEGRLTALAGLDSTAAHTDGGDDMAGVVRTLRIVPRAGLLVLLVVFLSMMVASRGLW